MPFTPNTPENKTVSVVTTPEVRAEQSKQLAKYHVTDLRFRLTPDDQSKTIVVVDLAIGYDDEGTFKSVRTERVKLSGATLLAAIGAMCSNSNSRWDEIKGAVWQLLQDEGHIPAGSIS